GQHDVGDGRQEVGAELATDQRKRWLHGLLLRFLAPQGWREAGDEIKCLLDKLLWRKPLIPSSQKGVSVCPAKRIPRSSLPDTSYGQKIRFSVGATKSRITPTPPDAP